MSLNVLKKLGAVAGILIVFWFLYLYHQVPHEKSPFAGVVDQADHIMISQAGHDLSLRQDAGQWKVGISTGTYFVADSELVKTLLNGLKGLQLDDEMTNRADRASDYEITPEQAIRVKVLDRKQINLADGMFGKQATDYNHLYFKYSDKPTVYLARGMGRSDLGHVDVGSWRSKQLVDIADTKIQQITIHNKGATTDLVRVSTDVWMMNAKPVDPTAINGLVGSLAHLRADSFLEPGDPKSSYENLTAARVEVKGSDSLIDLHIGPEDMATKRFPISSGATAGTAWISENTAKMILPNPSTFTLKSK